MTLAMHAFLHDKFFQLYGNLSTPVNTVAKKYCHRGWMLTPFYFFSNEIYN